MIAATPLVGGAVLLSIISITSGVISHNRHTPFNVFLHNCGSYQDKEKRMSLNIQILSNVENISGEWHLLGEFVPKIHQLGLKSLLQNSLTFPRF